MINMTTRGNPVSQTKEFQVMINNPINSYHQKDPRSMLLMRWIQIFRGGMQIECKMMEPLEVKMIKSN